MYMYVYVYVCKILIDLELSLRWSSRGGEGLPGEPGATGDEPLGVRHFDRHGAEGRAERGGTSSFLNIIYIIIFFSYTYII